MSGIDRAQNRFPIRLPRQHHAQGLRRAFLHFFQQLRSIHSRHSHVGNNDVEGLPVYGREGFVTAGGKNHFPFRAHGAQTALQPSQQHGFVINKQNSFGHDYPSAGFANGIRMWNVVPLPSSESNHIFPPCRLTMAVCARANPCPVPFPTGLVVKNGSNIRERAASGMPTPVSEMEMPAQSWSRMVETTIFPLV